MKDVLKDIREPNCVSNYIFHDQDSFCGLILYAARFHFEDRKSKTAIEGERPFMKVFLVARVLFRHLIVKLNIYLGKLS